ncbi:MAG: DEAD/DEAH box helicase [Candidatus Marsarchaeota archaeon]|nr:DEAD/DEAH box helicase [Candidatus Marsarchaeota archaeon]
MPDSFSPDWIVEPPRPAQYADEIKLAPALREVLRERGIAKFYSHQAQAIHAIREGKNIVLMAPTAAGKTECYMVPVVEAALQNQCSLLLFPTKALSRDQWNRIREFNLLGVRSAVYDGDVIESQRQKVRKDFPHVIITNFDMLHFMLLYPRIWAPFFARLKYVVIDEMHAYSGTVGSHVANVVWRLRRVLQKQREAQKVRADFDKEQEAKAESKKEKDEKKRKLKADEQIDLFGAPISTPAPSAYNVQFICSSATVGNPLEFASKLTGLPPTNLALIKGDGSPRGKTHHAVVSEKDESVVSQALHIAKAMDKKTIIFGNSHNMVERLGLVAGRMDLPLAVYRSGLPPQERRHLEASFHSGNIRLLAATSALELGMDVGDADMAILAGFPGTITRLRQRIGRVGRKGQDAYAVLVARANPLDQYYASNPKTYLNGLPESCHAKPDNPHIRKWHLLSAARDWPLDEADLQEGDAPLLQELMDENLLRKFGDSIVTSAEGTKKARTLSLRNAGQLVRIIDAESGKFLGEREQSIAIGELYEGAIYLIGGRRYASLGIDLDEGTARLTPIRDKDSVYTQALRTKRASIIEVEEEGQWGGVPLSRGPVHIVNEVYGFVRKDGYSGNTLSRKELDEPLTYEFDTHALWSDWSEWADGRLSAAEGLHALEHVSIAMMPALTGADPAEIGGISNPEGRIFYYEGSAGGSGMSEIVFRRFGECISMAEERLRTCACEKGCPSCIFSPQCGNNNNYLDKAEALALARKGLDGAKSKT